MLKNISIKQMVLGAFVTMMTLMIGITIFSFLSSNATQRELKTQLLMSKMLRSSMDADMDHDAIHSNVLSALRALEYNDAKGLEDARAEYKEHTESFHKNIDEILSKFPEEEIKHLYSQVNGELTEYLNYANTIILNANSQSDLGELYKVFFTYFKKMEEVMEKAGTKIQQSEGQYSKAVTQRIQEQNYIIGILHILAMAVFSALVYGIVNHVINPIKRLDQVMTSIAAGQKGLEIPYLDNQAEIGSMAQACQNFKGLVVKAEQLQKDQKSQSHESETTLKQQMLVLTDEIEKEMRETITQVMDNAETVLKISNEMNLSSQDVAVQATSAAHATQSAQSNVESVASATEELSLSVNEISKQVSHAAVTAQSAVASASQTNETVQRLADAVRSVGDVVLLISDIAEQTNLLALNATIEAARAGEAGKGFAVVAAEVQNLANQTTKATDGITGQITAIQGATENAVRAIDNIVRTIQEIDSISSSIAAAVEEQGVATNQISTNTQQAAEGTRDVSARIVDVNERFKHTTELSLQVTRTTDDVVKHITGLRTRMLEILRKSHAGDRRSSPRYKADGFSVMATYAGKSHSCVVKDISAEGIAIFSEEIGRDAKSSDLIGLEITGFPQMITARVCGVAAGEIIRLAFKGDDRLRASIERFVSARFAAAQNIDAA
ncbi:MAG: hypothetical protein C0514_02020 [Candidatus Puniceispirillum sp.]|nr:hypothetical protein [Candidatus Puniceispirillum sp.]